MRPEEAQGDRRHGGDGAADSCNVPAITLEFRDCGLEDLDATWPAVADERLHLRLQRRKPLDSLLRVVIEFGAHSLEFREDEITVGGLHDPIRLGNMERELKARSSQCGDRYFEEKPALVGERFSVSSGRAVGINLDPGRAI